MHFPLAIVVTLVGVVTLSACQPSSGPGPGADPAVPDASSSGQASDTLEIPVGSERSLADRRVAVRFLARLTESRCPANAMCVWQGDASVRLRIDVDTKVTETVLHTGVDPSSYTFQGFTFAIAGLFPYPGTYPEDAPPPSPTVHISVARQ